MSEIEAFFREIDRLWEPIRPGRIPLKLIGSGSLFLQADYSRTTKDGDVLETSEVTGEIKDKLKELAGKRTPLHKRTGLYLDIVFAGLPFLPQTPKFHPQPKLNASLRHFEVEVLDVVDVVVSKFSRFSPSDVEDARAMVKLGLVDHKTLIRRFEAAVDYFSMDARAEDFPDYVKNLHRVERDMLNVPESEIELPGWIG